MIIKSNAKFTLKFVLIRLKNILVFLKLITTTSLSTVYRLVQSGSVTNGAGGPTPWERGKGKRGKDRETGLKTKQPQVKA